MSENETLLQSALQTWAAAFNDGGAQKLAALYAPDAILCGTMSTALIFFADGIREYFERALAADTPPTVALGKRLPGRTEDECAMNSGTYAFTVDVEGL